MPGRRELLEQLRDELAARLAARAACDNDDHGRIGDKELPAISRELRMVLAELDAIPSTKKNAPTDEIAARYERRRQKAAGQ